jgi:(5-formylfuran-3-yl)methyl phosphate synthase
MRLLVSVRSGSEVRPALAGGADIIDAKEPSRGSLGAVRPEVLGEIAGLVPSDIPLSVALGDLTAPEIAGAVASVDGIVGARTELYVKLGLAGASDPRDAERRAMAATAATRRTRNPVLLVLVAYADHRAAESPPPDVVTQVAIETGADAILLDTHAKDGRDLFHYVGEAGLRAWVERTKDEMLIVAVAGSLTESHIHRIARMPADVVGVRGAACGGTRSGTVLEGSVRALKRVLVDAARTRSASTGMAPR